MRWLVLDCNYLLSRLFYAIRKISEQDDLKELIMMAVLDEFEKLQDRFVSSSFVFCFDGIRLKRKKVCEDYKALRSEDRVTTKRRRDLIEEIRNKYFKYFGNVFCKTGYEADDLIASVVQNLPKTDTKIIIAEDKDLYQLINNNTIVFHPRKKQLVDLKKFIEIYDIHPKNWGMVKAIAGCNSDNIQGVMYVGEKTAAKYLNNNLPKRSKAWQRIRTKSSTKIIKRNLPLVKLPFTGTPVCTPEPNNMRDFIARRAAMDMGIDYYS